MSRCLDINFRYLDNTVAATAAATVALDTRISDYNGVRSRISNTNSNTSNLYTANTYIDKKKRALKDKRDKLRQFNKDIVGFGAVAKAQDVKTAAAIHISGHSFYHREGLAHGALYTIGAVISDGTKWLADKAKKAIDTVVTWGKKAWEKVKELYEKNKYWIDVLVDVVSVVAGVVALAAAVATLFAATGPLAVALAIGGLFAASWGMFKSTSSLAFDSAALYFHVTGDDELAKEFNGKGSKDILQQTFGEKVGGVLYTGLDIAAAVCSIGTLLQKAYEFDGKTFESLKDMKLSKKKILLGFDGTTPTDTLSNAKKITGNIKFCLSLPKNILKNGMIEGLAQSFASTKDGFAIGKYVGQGITALAY